MNSSDYKQGKLESPWVLFLLKTWLRAKIHLCSTDSVIPFLCHSMAYKLANIKCLSTSKFSVLLCRKHTHIISVSVFWNGHSVGWTSHFFFHQKWADRDVWVRAGVTRRETPNLVRHTPRHLFNFACITTSLLTNMSEVTQILLFVFWICLLDMSLYL